MKNRKKKVYERKKNGNIQFFIIIYATIPKPKPFSRIHLKQYSNKEANLKTKNIIELIVDTKTTKKKLNIEDVKKKQTNYCASVIYLFNFFSHLNGIKQTELKNKTV